MGERRQFLLDVTKSNKRVRLGLPVPPLRHLRFRKNSARDRYFSCETVWKAVSVWTRDVDRAGEFH